MKISEITAKQIKKLKKEFEFVDRLYVDGYGAIKLREPSPKKENGKRKTVK